MQNHYPKAIYQLLLPCHTLTQSCFFAIWHCASIAIPITKTAVSWFDRLDGNGSCKNGAANIGDLDNVEHVS